MVADMAFRDLRFIWVGSRMIGIHLILITSLEMCDNLSANIRQVCSLWL